jgi:hypothetical protein
MCFSVLLLGLGLVAADGEHLDRRQIADLLRQLRAPVRDYECLYEGQETRFKEPDLTGLPDMIRKATARDPSFHAGAATTYQGSYACRADSSVHIDVSIKGTPPKPLRREVLCLFRAKGSKRVIIPDEGGVTTPDVAQSAGTIFVKKTFSLLRVDMFPYLLECVLIEQLGCVSPGWEDIDGHRCLVIDFPRMDDKKERRVWGERYWVDVARGGCVLKYEWDEEGAVTARLTEVMLSQELARDGELVWIPIAGRLLFYRAGFRAMSKAQSEQTYNVLHGTLKINTGLSDQRFDLNYGVDDRTRASAAVVNKTKVPKRRDLPADSESSLKRAVKDSDDPSKRLVATPASAESWISRNLMSALLLAGGGVVLLVSSILIRRAN